MNRRWTVLAGALALALAAPQATAAVTPGASRQPGVRTDRGADQENGLNRLRADATGKLRVHRAADGAADYVSSTNGRAMLEGGSRGPARTAADQLAKYGEAFGIDGGLSRAVVEKTLDSATGGSVVRSEQVVDGIPVFGGQIVMSLDEDQGVVSVDAATTQATEVPAAVVGETQARRSALAVTAKTHRVGAAELTATSKGRRLYDPAIVHTSDPMGVRPVWEFEVTNGFDIRETVLIGTGRGEVALHFNDAPHASDPAMNRRVCDNAELRLTNSSSPVPVCDTPARSEGLPASVVSDVDAAYDNLGATSDAYYDLDGLSLTDLIGATVLGTKSLQSTVRWCVSDDTCPYNNAFWDGTQMVFGTGYAAADDVVAHELTHGYVERTSALFMFHQSAALNESLADVIGEVVDHRNDPSGTEDNSAWDLGEDIPGGAIRNLQDPTEFDQPDRMTSPLFVTADIFADNGAVHANDGVGNKTAYLVSQGGTFNGQTITGIDGSDAGLAKTGRLYLETIPRLTSGAQYADLGRTLVATCDELAGSATGGFTTDDCASVSGAVAATELSMQPTDPKAANAEAPATCAAGASRVNLKQDDDGVQEFGFTANGLWQRTPANDTPVYARSGDNSWFGWDPDPSLPNGIATSSLTSSSFVVPSAQSTYVRFNHAYLFEWYDADPGLGYPAWYPDGGNMLVQTLSGSTWTTRTVTWNNGPDKLLDDTATKVFGGDSHGYGSSRANLTSLAGQTARVVFRVSGDADTYALGWWVDDIGLYTCPNAVASVPASTVAASTTSARVSWTPPAYVGSSPVASYKLTRSDGKVNTAPATARSLNLTGLKANTAVNVAVAAVAQNDDVGAASVVPIYGTLNTVTSSTARAVKGRAFTVTAKVVRRGTSSVVSGMSVTLQRRVKGQTVWRTVSTGATSAKGTRSWSLKQSSVTSYRAVSLGVRNWLGSTSASRTVNVR